eukprot:3473753-Prymnesium_polylepis.1
MAQGCAAALVRSGERGRHAVYLESAVRRTRDSPKSAITQLSQMPRRTGFATLCVLCGCAFSAQRRAWAACVCGA